MKYTISFFFVFSLFCNAFGQFNNGGFSEFKMDQIPTVKKTKPTIAPTTDSLFVDVSNGQKYLVHTVKAGQTIYSIKKFYGVDFSDIYYSNPGLETRGLKIEQNLQIPVINKAITFFRKSDFRDTSFIPVFYKVKAQETMFRISRVHFRVSADILKSRNNLLTDDLSKNQVLHIGWISKAGVPDSLKKYTGLAGVLGEQDRINKYRYEAKLAVGKEYMEDGTACWDKNMNLSSKNKLYVMCSHVEAGGVVRLENTMTKRFLYAKVVAPKPENSLTTGTIIMLTPAVANALGGLDSRFYIKLYYCK